MKPLETGMTEFASKAGAQPSAGQAHAAIFMTTTLLRITQGHLARAGEPAVVLGEVHVFEDFRRGDGELAYGLGMGAEESPEA